MAGPMVYVTLYCRARKVVSDQRTSSTSSPPRALSSKLTCGLTNLDVAHWPSLENMADRRPRREYGTSGRAGSWGAYRRLDNAEKIAVPLSIVHGEKNSRVPVLVSEALRFVGHRMREHRRGTDGVRVGRPRCRTGSTGYSRETDAQRFFLSSLRIRVQAETRHRIVSAKVRVDARK